MYQALGDIVGKLSHLKWSCSYNPLIITSGRGLLNTEHPGDEGRSPTKLASKYGFLKVLEWLIDSQNCELSTDNHEDSAISPALRSGSEKVATRVLQALFDESLTKAPLGLAVMDYDDSDDSDWSLEMSEDSGSPPATVVNTWKGAALVDAVQCGSGDAVLDILLNESDSNARDLKARTLLTLAAMNGSIRLVERLLQAQASLGAREYDGRTAMHHACGQGHMSVLEVLAKNPKLNLMAQDKSLHTPMSMAIRTGYQHIVMLLLPRLAYGALKMEFLLTVGNGQREILDQILDFAKDFDSNALQD